MPSVFKPRYHHLCSNFTTLQFYPAVCNPPASFIRGLANYTFPPLDANSTSPAEKTKGKSFCTVAENAKVSLTLPENVTRSCTHGNIACWLSLCTKAFMNAPKCMCTTWKQCTGQALFRRHFSMLCVMGLVLKEKTLVVLFSLDSCKLHDEEVYRIYTMN